jgi:hypothetical protein
MGAPVGMLIKNNSSFYITYYVNPVRAGVAEPLAGYMLTLAPGAESAPFVVNAEGDGPGAFSMTPTLPTVLAQPQSFTVNGNGTLTFFDATPVNYASGLSPRGSVYVWTVTPSS